jgi:hypothetical protein
MGQAANHTLALSTRRCATLVVLQLYSINQVALAMTPGEWRRHFLLRGTVGSRGFSTNRVIVLVQQLLGQRTLISTGINVNDKQDSNDNSFQTIAAIYVS